MYGLRGLSTIPTRLQLKTQSTPVKLGNAHESHVKTNSQECRPWWRPRLRQEIQTSDQEVASRHKQSMYVKQLLGRIAHGFVCAYADMS